MTTKANLSGLRFGIGFLLTIVLVVTITTITSLDLMALSEDDIETLIQLEPPAELLNSTAMRVAQSSTAQALTLSRAVSWGAETADHIHGLAQHQAMIDRPRRHVLVDTLRPDESLRSFCRRWRLGQQDLEQLNPELELENLEEEAELAVWRYDPEQPARSMHRPNQGQLHNGELMPEGNGWIVRNIRKSFGVERTIDGIIHAMRVTMAEHPKGQDMLVSDLSFREGGYMPAHRSHQSGRDVDLTYYRYTNDEPTYRRTRIRELDVHRTWTLVRTLATEHPLEYIFMNQPHQVALYEHAERIGEHPAFLASIFQHGPRQHRNSSAIIRCSPGHDDHIHVRFQCGEDDYRCRGVRRSRHLGR